VEWEQGKIGPAAYVISQNLKRRHLDKSQAAACAVEALPLLEKEAKERQREHGGTAPGKTATVRPKMDEVSGRSDAQAAKVFNVSRGYVADAKALKVKVAELVE
jgi:hypothetical protein